MPRCELRPGAVIFYEQFEGVNDVKDRYFVIVKNATPTVHCFTTTTIPWPERNSRWAREYFEIKEDECCLPKRCFVDFIHPEYFDDIALGSKLTSRRVKHKCDLDGGLMTRLRDALYSSRTLSPAQKAELVFSLDERIRDGF